jgi:hypothetical protein
MRVWGSRRADCVSVPRGVWLSARFPFCAAVIDSIGCVSLPRPGLEPTRPPLGGLRTLAWDWLLSGRVCAVCCNATKAGRSDEAVAELQPRCARVSVSLLLSNACALPRTRMMSMASLEASAAAKAARESDITRRVGAGGAEASWVRGLPSVCKKAAGCELDV